VDLSLFSLEGKVAVVTGATAGSGQAMCVALAKAGADIVGVGSSGNFTATQPEVAACGTRFSGIQCDLSRMEEVRRLIPEAQTVFGRIDVLVNNAGIIRRTPSTDFSEEDWDAVMNVNVKAAFFLAQAAANVFIEQGSGGKIINVASLLSFQGGITVPSYTASKSALAGVTKTLSNEWASKGINVNAIAPGYIATNNTEALQKDPIRNKAILERIPAGRWGSPEDLGGIAVFLASAASNYCHGATYLVDGGWMGR
jgi:2-dehydro-3-deoxy-D-gluconate 5-dehydrogenase